MKLRNAVLLLLMCLLVTGCGVWVFGTADLSTEEVKSNPDAEKGMALLAKMRAAHGVEVWSKVQTYEADFSDTFFGKLPMEHPFNEDEVEMTLQYIPNSFDGKAIFKSGMPAGAVWGLQSWQSYQLEGDQKPVFKQDKEIVFWLPTYQYFIEFPLRIQSADIVLYAGERNIEGVACEGIYATWKSAGKQRDIDQYLIWLNKKTGLIEFLEYTIREKFNFLTGGAYHREYKDFDGLKVPTYFPVVSNLVRKGYLHEMRINDLRVNTIDASEIRIKDLPEMGDAKP